LITLRDYQEESVARCYDWLQTRDGHPLIIIPTGGGKTPVIATLCADAVTLWNGRVLVLAHVKELLEQTAGTLRKMCPTLPVGVYSAGLKSREVRAVTVAGIQSVYDRASQLGRVDLVIVDEAHLIPPDGDGMYRTLLESLQEINRDLRVIGLTATPYRLSGGMIYGEDRLFEERCHEVGVKELVMRGFLSPLVGKAALCEIDTDGLKVVRGEYEEGKAEQLFTDVVGAAVDEVVSKTVDRRAVLLFCQTVAHGQRVATKLRADIVGREERALAETAPAREMFGMGDDPLAFHALHVAYDWLIENNHPVDSLAEFIRRGRATVGEIYGDTPADERAGLIEKFRTGQLRYLVNVNVLTTGFDAPNVDCVCLLRATVSAGLYYQMVGRGFRLSPGKVNCLVLDFGQNIKRHGPVDRVNGDKGKKKGDGEAVSKMCPECRSVVAGGTAVCPDCNYVWPNRELKPNHDGRADGEDPLSTGKPKVEEMEVLGVEYKVHTKKDAQPGHPKTMCVKYKTGVGQYVSEWVCVEHEPGTFARSKAEQWWRKRCNFPMPNGVAECVSVANHGLLAVPTSLTTKKKPGEKYPEISGVELGDKPTHPTPCPQCGAVNESVIVAAPEPYYAGRVVCGMCNHYLWPAAQEVVERYGFYSDHQPGMLPDGYEFGDEVADGFSLFDAIDQVETEAPQDSEDIPDGIPW
jgi:DNA repair protein RadD